MYQEGSISSICLFCINAKSAPSFHSISKLDLGDNLVCVRWPWSVIILTASTYPRNVV